ncbi:hypothetical protein SETIT_3G054000v2 [Setaria italica]|uniref:Uncharacterized protein n=2 Tax=Setaria TaxID=4554 RepID=A0A368QBU4_SETIT|nr:hypothetical protein SETIT_3G054000v2 [Setaria italica]TKW24502.1 hypothetical protein SEVIR_3G054700v2 [Setaria viridis]
MSDMVNWSENCFPCASLTFQLVMIWVYKSSGIQPLIPWVKQLVQWGGHRVMREPLLFV